MQSLAERFYEIGEPYAGGLFEQPGRGPFYRYARAQRMFWERQQMPEYLGGKLYPAGRKYPNPPAVVPDFSYTVSVEIDWERLYAKDAACCRAMRRMGAPADAEAPRTSWAARAMCTPFPTMAVCSRRDWTAMPSG